MKKVYRLKMIPKGNNVKQMSRAFTHRTDSEVTRADRRLFQLAGECTLNLSAAMQ